MKNDGNRESIKVILMKTWRKMNNWVRVPFVLLVFVLPFVIIAIAEKCGCEWLGRLIVLSIALPIGAIVTLWYGISPKTQMIKEGGKLNRPEFKKVKPYVALILRLLFIILGIFLIYQMILFTVDIRNIIHNKNPCSVTGKIKLNDTPFGMWFLLQSPLLDKEPEEGYQLIYSLKPRLKTNMKYEFWVLPKSKMILQVRKLPENDVQ